MARTPSMGIDQNLDGKFIDKYWGIVPQFIIYQPENYRCEVNPDYLFLLQAYINGEIDPDNISQDLRFEIENIVINADCPCLLSGKERAILIALSGGEPCAAPSSRIACNPGDKICCNATLLCDPVTLCEDNNDDCFTGMSTYDIEIEYDRNNDRFGARSGVYGKITLIEGIDLGLTEFNSLYYNMEGAEELEYYIGFDTVCSGQITVAVEFISETKDTVLLDSNPSYSSAATQGAVHGDIGLEEYDKQTIAIKVRRNGCDQCNLEPIQGGK